MVDSHHVMVTAILLAVVVVGISGLYFSLVANHGPDVVYVGSSASSAGLNKIYQPVSRSLTAQRPFRVMGHGITGRSVEQFGTTTVTLTSTLDLRCPKCTITCTGSIDQDSDAATFYTCGDAANEGGTLICDGGNVTDATTCSNAGPNDGAFFLTNNGANATLQATLISLTLDGVNTTTIYLDNILYNSLEAVTNGNGCTGTDCNNCPAPDTPGCEKALPGNTFIFNDTVQECDDFETSGEGVCECFSIHIPDEDDIHMLKNGATLEFVIKKTLVQPSESPCSA